MKNFTRGLKNPFKDRTLVNRSRAADYLLITLLSFAFSVSATRLFLELTGYPQLGTGTLHIAHVLWGGVILFIASILPIIYVNEWIVPISAMLSGLGVGLFIDEVGKFITQTNDYFYPSAAPIIYVFFLLTVFVFSRVKTQQRVSSRTIFYNVMERLTEILDHDLSSDESFEIIRRLEEVISRNDEPELVKFAQEITAYLRSRETKLISHDPTFFEKITSYVEHLENKWFLKPRMKLIIFTGLVIWGGWAFISPIGFFLLSKDPIRVQSLINQLLSSNLVQSASGLTWFEARVLLEGGMGIFAMIAAILFIVKLEKAGVWLAISTLLITLSVVNLLVFYFDQFSTIAIASYQFVLIVILLRYQRRFIQKPQVLK
jgi:hypothetical protein